MIIISSFIITSEKYIENKPSLNFHHKLSERINEVIKEYIFWLHHVSFCESDLTLQIDPKYEL